MLKFVKITTVLSLILFNHTQSSNATIEPIRHITIHCLDADTIQSLALVPKTPFEISDSICKALGVPPGLIREIGKNESQWTWNVVGSYQDRGYLQIIPSTYNYWYDKLGLTGGYTKRNHLIVGISYLRWQYDRYGSWYKARFAYGRGSWRPPSTWTEMERAFMANINWQKYGQRTKQKTTSKEKSTEKKATGTEKKASS